MRVAFAIIALLLAASCSDDAGPGPAPVNEPVGRVVIAYLCGDNNLSSEVEAKIGALHAGMKRAGTVDGRLVVYADYRDALPRLVEITAETVTTLETLAELNSASPANLRSILQRIVSDFPAESYGLICFSHASGWLPKGALENPAGFAAAQAQAHAGAQEQAHANAGVESRTIFDDQGSEMPTADFAGAIDVLPDGGKFDFIIFEACYMAGIEVVYELKDRTRYIVASSAEILSDGFAEIYPAGLGLLFEPEPALETFARNYFDRWNAKAGAWRSATISLINTAYVDETAGIIDEIAAGNPDWAGAIDISSLQHFNRNPHRLFFDLGQTVENVADPQQLAAFGDALAKMVEYKAATPYFMSGKNYSYAISRHSGLTAYIIQGDYPLLNDSYAQTGWYRFLNGE